MALADDIAVLQAVSKELFQVRTTTSTSVRPGPTASPYRWMARSPAPVGTPKPDEHLLALTHGAVIDLIGSAAGTTEIAPEVSSLDYVG